MKDEDLDQLFSEHFKEESQTPGASVWKKIESQLDADQQPATPIYRHIKPWKRYFAVAAACLCIGFAALWLFQQQDETAPQQTTLLVENSRPTVKTTPDESAVVDSKTASPTQELIAAVEAPKKSIIKSVERPKDKLASTKKQSKQELQINFDNLKTATVEIDSLNRAPQLTLSSIDVAPLKPLIENPEEEETMLASTDKQSVITKLLNTVSGAIAPEHSKNIHFSKDEEGTLKIDLNNSLVRTRKPKIK